MDEGAAVLIDSTRGDGGTIFVQSATVPAPSPQPRRNPRARAVHGTRTRKLLPQMGMAAEHYNRIVRMMQAGEKVKMKRVSQVEWQDKDLNGLQHRRRNPRHRSL